MEKKLLVLSALVVLILGSFLIWRSQPPKMTTPPSSTRNFLTKGKIKDYIKLSDRLLLVNGASSTDMQVSPKYLVNTRIKIKDTSYLEGAYEKTDYARLYVYDIDTPFKEGGKEIDLKKKLSRYNEKFMFMEIYGIRQHKKTGDYYLPIGYINTDDELQEATLSSMSKIKQRIYLNLRTETFETKEDDLEKVSSNIGDIYSTDTTNLYELTGKGATLFVSSMYIGLGSGYKTMKLYSKYSLETYNVDDSYDLYWYGEPNSKELAELLAPEGQTDIFQGVTLYGAYSKDGQDHVVQSYDELMSWYQEPAETETSASSSSAE